jgi:iron(III) transport system ATP-binding protein
LLGPSGCGKSTLLRLISGLETPDSGSLYFNDQDVTHTSAGKRKVGYVFQQYALWPHLTVRGNLAFGLTGSGLSHREIEQRIKETLTMLGIDLLEDRSPHQLSGGQQQRVALARSLVLRPPLLLLDEPLSNLDAALKDDFLRSLGAIHSEFGTTIIYVTHDKSEALAYGDRIAILRSGNVVEIDTPQTLYLRPKTLAAALTVGRANTLRGSLTLGSSDSLEFNSSRSKILLRHGDRDLINQKVVLVVRPEMIQLVEENERWLTFGEVERVRFQGAFTDLDIRIYEGVNWTVRTSSANPSVQVGRKVYLAAPDDALLLYPQETERDAS